MLTLNQTAPNFASPNQNNEIIALPDFAGKKVVLYFYPKDDTPGCTIEANDFSALVNEFATANTKVIGVSRDDFASHQAFIDKFGLKIDLLSDTLGEICEAYGVWQEKNKEGKTYMGIVRSTFVINETGELRYVEYGVDPNGHAEKVLAFVQNEIILSLTGG